MKTSHAQIMGLEPAWPKEIFIDIGKT